MFELISMIIDYLVLLSPLFVLLAGFIFSLVVIIKRKKRKEKIGVYPIVALCIFGGILVFIVAIAITLIYGFSQGMNFM